MAKTLIVIGGGAAGFFCAVNAARMDPGLETILLEKSSKMLSKVKVSGGGRCNVTHACYSIEDMIRKYPRGFNFLKKAFHHFFTTDIIRWFEERGVALKTEADGRIFPVTNNSQTIIDCLMAEASSHAVKIWLHREVKKIEVIQQVNEDGKPDPPKRFKVFFSATQYLESDFVCIASGGYPKLPMFDWLGELGHSIEAPVPSLFTFNMPANPVTQLMGVSVADAQVKILGSKLSERGPLLITHWGMSGPVILRLSAWGAREFFSSDYRFTAIVNWLPELNENTLRERIKELREERSPQKMSGRNPFGLPQRLWDYMLSQAGITVELRWADLPAVAQNKLIKLLCAHEYQVQGKTTFKEEFVTAGGVRLTEIDPHTMQSRKIRGLYFSGEAMDVDGITGGFNFQHAWTSGFIAAEAISAEARDGRGD
jgi:predicted Rossmann fold flavoprotein